MKPAALVCTSCCKEFPFKSLYPRCSVCGEPLEVVCHESKKGRILPKGTLLERYADFLPFDEIHSEISLGEGNTPLLKSSVVAEEAGIQNLYFKNETLNPTWSFKDRGTVAGLEHALALGARRIGTVSTGNMAASVAAYGARAKLETFILVSHNLPEEKIAPIAVYNPRLILVEGDYGDLYFRSLEIGQDLGIYFINSDAPLRVEGSKTIAFEICEQLDFNVSDYVAVPVSAGGNLRGIIKGFEEFCRAGLIERIPTVIAVQAGGCSPIVNAFEKGLETITRFRKPDTIAHAISNPFPPSGNQVLRKLREHDGMAVKVDDNEILAAQRLMAKEGIFGQPAAAAPLAAVKKLLDQDRLKLDESVVCVVTGSGLKYAAALQQQKTETTPINHEELDQVLEKILSNEY